MKILFGGRFWGCPGIGKIQALERLGHTIYPLDYGCRKNRGWVANAILEASEGCDVVLLAKISALSNQFLIELTEKMPTIYWYNDGTDHWRREQVRASLCSEVIHHSHLLAERLGHLQAFEGYSPEFDYPRDVEQDIPVIFLGSKKNRQRRGYRESVPFKRVKRSTPEEHAIWVSRSKINLNFTQNGNLGFSDRVFKTLAAGGFLLSNNCKEITSVFTPGEHLDVFNSEEELKEKIQYYLDHPEERMRIAEAGREFVLPRFSNDNWAETIDRVAQDLVSKRLQER